MQRLAPVRHGAHDAQNIAGLRDQDVTPEFSIRPGAGPPCTLRSTRRATQRDFRDNVEESSPV